MPNINHVRLKIIVIWLTKFCLLSSFFTSRRLYISTREIYLSSCFCLLQFFIIRSPIIFNIKWVGKLFEELDAMVRLLCLNWRIRWINVLKCQAPSLAQAPVLDQTLDWGLFPIRVHLRFYKCVCVGWNRYKVGRNIISSRLKCLNNKKLPNLLNETSLSYKLK